MDVFQAGRAGRAELEPGPPLNFIPDNAELPPPPPLEAVDADRFLRVNRPIMMV